MIQTANTDQADVWNGDLARRWLAHETELDAMTREATDLLERAIAAGPGQHLLEVGCGTGDLAFRLARAVAPEGEVLALDISAPLLDRARDRAGGMPNLTFSLADAQVADLPEANFDVVLSNFGIMFFDDPVAAFANLRRALRPGGRLVFVCFGPVAGNLWFSLPRAAAVARLGAPPPPPPNAPGPLAFADTGHVTGLMRAAGFADCRAEAHRLHWIHPGGPAAAARLAVALGPAASVLRERGGSTADEDAIRADIARAFAPYAGPDGARLPVEVLLYQAVNR
jgi:SAM-dependent methyltransferase